MQILKAMTATLMLAALPLAAHTEDMSYSYVDLGYIETDIDGVGPKADGFATRGSVGFAENFFAFGEYSNQSINVIDIEQYAVGLGYHHGLTEALDLVGRAGWIKADVSSGGASVDDDGYLVSAGLRGQVGERVELEGGLIYTDFGGSSGDDTAFAFGGRYHFNDTFAVGAEYQQSDDLSSIIAGVRISF